MYRNNSKWDIRGFIITYRNQTWTQIPNLNFKVDILFLDFYYKNQLLRLN